MPETSMSTELTVTMRWSCNERVGGWAKGEIRLWMQCLQV
jgi:hypothetical protein